MTTPRTSFALFVWCLLLLIVLLVGLGGIGTRFRCLVFRFWRLFLSLILLSIVVVSSSWGLVRIAIVVVVVGSRIVGWNVAFVRRRRRRWSNIRIIVIVIVVILLSTSSPIVSSLCVVRSVGVVGRGRRVASSSAAVASTPVVVGSGHRLTWYQKSL